MHVMVMVRRWTEVGGRAKVEDHVIFRKLNTSAERRSNSGSSSGRFRSKVVVEAVVAVCACTAPTQPAKVPTSVWGKFSTVKTCQKGQQYKALNHVLAPEAANSEHLSTDIVHVVQT